MQKFIFLELIVMSSRKNANHLQFSWRFVLKRDNRSPRKCGKEKRKEKNGKAHERAAGSHLKENTFGEIKDEG